MARQQTPSDIKWLVNELAAARGELARLGTEVELAKSQLERAQADQARQAALCSSLEQVLSLSSVVPLGTGAFIVTVHKKYGGRGKLRLWLKDALREAHPYAPTGVELFERAIPVFGLEFTSPGARAAYYRNTIHRQLYHFAELGLVQRVEVVEGAIRVRWRWAAQSSLDELKVEHSEETL